VHGRSGQAMPRARVSPGFWIGSFTFPHAMPTLSPPPIRISRFPPLAGGREADGGRAVLSSGRPRRGDPPASRVCGAGPSPRKDVPADGGRSIVPWAGSASAARAPCEYVTTLATLRCTRAPPAELGAAKAAEREGRRVDRMFWGVVTLRDSAGGDVWRRELRTAAKSAAEETSGVPPVECELLTSRSLVLWQWRQSSRRWKAIPIHNRRERRHAEAERA